MVRFLRRLKTLIKTQGTSKVVNSTIELPHISTVKQFSTGSFVFNLNVWLSSSLVNCATSSSLKIHFNGRRALALLDQRKHGEFLVQLGLSLLFTYRKAQCMWYPLTLCLRCRCNFGFKHQLGCFEQRGLWKFTIRR